MVCGYKLDDFFFPRKLCRRECQMFTDLLYEIMQSDSLIVLKIMQHIFLITLERE